jgi:predicted acyl esterase
MPFQVGEIINLKFYLQPISVLIKKGHQIRLAIAGHDKDTFIRIPEKGNPIITVYRNKIYNSYIDLPIIKK